MNGLTPEQHEQLGGFLEDTEGDFHEIVTFVRDVILPCVVTRLNSAFSAYHIGKLPSEKLPTNERNLTDARTRIGVLLEYALGQELHRVFLPHDMRVGYIVANRYPDLAVRDSGGVPKLRFEVKAIQAISEEKAANFDAAVWMVHKRRDILCVLVWEWRTKAVGAAQIEYPHVYQAFAFDAYKIATVRDLGWIYQHRANSPKKAIDLSGPIVGGEAGWKAEEHNMGKLMRIASTEMMSLPVLADYQEDPEIVLYQGFKEYSAGLGVEYVAQRLLTAVACENLQQVGRFSAAEPRVLFTATVQHQELAVVGGQELPGWNDAAALLAEADLAVSRVLLFNHRFCWKLTDGEGNALGSGKKPGEIAAALR